jgi:hypothetical protein
VIDISLCTKLLVVIKISLVRRGTIARQQATVMSFADVFVILTALFVVLRVRYPHAAPRAACGGCGRTLIGGNTKGISYAGTGPVRNKHHLQFRRMGNCHVYLAAIALPLAH